MAHVLGNQGEGQGHRPSTPPRTDKGYALLRTQRSMGPGIPGHLRWSLLVLLCCQARGKVNGKEDRVLFLHVGKAGGSSVRSFLTDNKIWFKEIHVQQPTPEQVYSYKRILVTVRDPTARVLSAYKWKHPHGGGLKPTYAAERELYTCFPNLNSYAEAFLPTTKVSPKCANLAMYSVVQNITYPLRGLSCSHTCRGYAFYAGPWLEEICRKRPYVVQTEHMAGDLRGIGRWLGVAVRTRVVPHRKGTYRRQYDNVTNPRALMALRGNLGQEYDVYHRLLRCAINAGAGPSGT